MIKILSIKFYGCLIAICSLVPAYLSCSKLLPGQPAGDLVLDGPVDGLTAAEKKIFLAGDRSFNNEVFTPATGLGPLFVSNSCGSCHAGDGKGHPSTMLTRFGQLDSTGNSFLFLGGPQLQHLAIPGYVPETIPANATFSRFMPPANTGLGFVDAVPDATLLALSDEKDLDGDGISGRPNWINIPSYCVERPLTIKKNNKYIGRFGKKASVYNLLQQTVNAYNQDMGINSTFETYNTYNGFPSDPEVLNNTIEQVVFYLQTLKSPLQRGKNDRDIGLGRAVFMQTGCGKCHIPELKTGISSVSALSEKVFFPFSDFLLHDMGPELDDHYTEGSALSSEWRTPPLWGLGLSPNSQGKSYFLLHDGRARSIEEAIEFHGGEGSRSRTQFKSLSDTDKRNLIKFLESL